MSQSAPLEIFVRCLKNVPHHDNSLTIDFFTKFQDDPYDAPQLNTSFGESWGLDNFQIMLIDKPMELDDEQMQACFDALLGDDPVRSAAARWRLVAAENASVQFLEKWFEADETAKQRFCTEGNFEFFRLDRLLQLIGTPDAESLRQKNQYRTLDKKSRRSDRKYFGSFDLATPVRKG